ncbi:MAG TPA: ABC transporter permease [Acidobacteriaceae bacterium]|jgi:predicted permease|nr:ABC transporter permease [Acidobacteriaceae bacterium]
MHTLMANLRYAVRQLWRARTFTIVTILTLALGVGANTAIFSVVQAVLLQPAGVNDPARVASFHVRYAQLNLPSIGVSAPDFADAQSLTSIVESAAMERPDSFNATFDGRTQHLRASTSTWQWFQVYGAQPILGRTFSPEEDQKGANQEVVLSYSTWQQLFGGQHSAIGQSLLLDGKSYHVIGVMRSDFDWPRNTQMWIPLGLAPPDYAADNRFNESYTSVVRLRPGVTAAQFNSALEQKRLEEIRREGTGSFAERAGWAMFAQPWTQDAAGDLRKPLLALFAVVAMILLIACANISGLMLARASTRTRELAIRTALGASLGKILDQFVVETVLLAGTATLLAILSGPALGRLLLLAIPHDLAAGFAVRNNLSVVLVAAGFGLLTSLLAGLAPVLQIARSYKALRLSEHGRNESAGPAKQRFRGVLVATEIALAFLLVAGAGLFLSSLKQLQNVNPGFSSTGVLAGSVTLNASNYDKQPLKEANFLQNVTSHLSQQPGVVAAAAVYPLPFSQNGYPSGSFQIENHPSQPNDPGPHGDRAWATPGYLQTMQIPLLRGRWFSEEDRAGHPPVAVIDDMLANAYWPGQNPIGQHVRGGGSPWVEIIGVVGHIRRDSLEVDENKGVIYQSMAQVPIGEASFVVRTAISPDSMRATLAEAVVTADSSEAIYNVHTVGSLVDESLAPRRLLVGLLTLFSGLALLLAAIGIYGMLSFSAAQRTTEIGIRMALGAQRWQVIALVLRQSFILIGIGLGAGLLLTFAAQRILSHSFAAMNSGMSSSLLLAGLSLVLVAALAAAIPANRSASVDPVIALRNE